jgi:flagellar basal-body rod modification protein FlgD
MTTIDTTSGAASTLALPGASGAAPATSAAQDASDRFLTLLVTQMKNQDPLNPLDNAQVTTQLAQISTVAGIDKLNDTVATLGASFRANQYLQSAALVGHDVAVAGNTIDLVDGKAQVGVALDAAADDVVVTISDASSGKVVRTLDAGKASAGMQFFDWDGKDDTGASLTDGVYTFSVAATSGKAAVNAQAIALLRVTGVSSAADGTTLHFAHGASAALADVREIH